MNNYVITVDSDGREIGKLDKIDAHKGQGILHRAISVVLYREQGNQIEILIQKRSENKLLWPGVWSNTVCTHPKEDESLVECAGKRLIVEMGIKIALEKLIYFYSFIYQAKFNDDYSENEYDYVYLANFDGEIKINLEEVEEYKWINLINLNNDIKDKPDNYTPWFKLITAKLTNRFS